MGLENVSDYIKGYIERARIAQEEFSKYDQEGVDLAVKVISKDK